MNFSEMGKAVEEARTTINRADNYVGDMARIIAGRLRKSNVSPSVLRELKKELQKYNMHTSSWSDE